MSYYPPPAGGYPPANSAAPTHNMALVSLIFGVLGIIGVCPGLGSIIAIITGGMAQRDIQTNPAQYSGDGLAKAGVILGWVGVVLGLIVGCFIAVTFLIPLLIALFAAGSGEFSALLRLAL